MNQNKTVFNELEPNVFDDGDICSARKSDYPLLLYLYYTTPRDTQLLFISSSGTKSLQSTKHKTTELYDSYLHKCTVKRVFGELLT